VGAELLAVFQNKGGTITTKVKRSRILHSAMVSLLTWALVHFTVDPPGVATNVAVAIGGAGIGAAVSRPRPKQG
jgi:hypothetical protein